MDPPPSNVEDLRQNLLVAAYQRFASPKGQAARGANRSGSIEGSESGLAPHLRIVDVYSLNEGPASFPIELTSDLDGSLEVERGDLWTISDHDMKPGKKDKESADKDFESQKKELLECMLRKERDVVSFETKKKTKKEKKREPTQKLLNDGMGANVMKSSKKDEGRTKQGKKKRKRLYDAHVGEPLEWNGNIGQLANQKMEKKKRNEEKSWKIPPDENVPDEGVRQKKKKNKNKSNVASLDPVEETDQVLNEAIIQKVKKGKNNIFGGEPRANVQIQQSETAPKDNATQPVKERKRKKKKKSEKDRVDIGPDDEDVVLEDAPFKHPLKRKKFGQRKEKSECHLIEKPNQTVSKVIENEPSENLPDILPRETIENNETIRKKKKKKKRSKGVQEWEISEFAPSEKSIKETINRHSQEAPGQDSINLSGVEEPLLKKKKKKKSKEKADNDPLENPLFALSEELHRIANKNRSQATLEDDFKTASQVDEPRPKKKKRKKSKDRAHNDPLENPLFALSEELLPIANKNRSQGTLEDDFKTTSEVEEPPLKKKKKSKDRADNDPLENPLFALSEELLPIANKNRSQGTLEDDFKTTSEVEEPPPKKKKKSKDRADPLFALSEELLPIANTNQSQETLLEDDFKTSSEVQEPPPKKKKKKKSKDRTENDTLVNPALSEESLARKKLTKKKKRSQDTAEDEALVEIVMPEELSPIKKKKKKLKERIQNDTLENPNTEMDETRADVCVRLKKPEQVTSKDLLGNESLVSVAKRNKNPLEAPKRKKKAKESIEIPIEIEGEPAKKVKKSEGRTEFESVTNQSITEKNQNQTDDEVSCKPREKFHKKKKKKKTKEKNKIPTEHELISGEEAESNTDNGLTKKKKRKTKAKHVHEDSTEPPEKRQKKAIGTHETIPPEESQSLGNVSLGCVMEPIDPKKKKKKNVSKENQDETMGWGSISRIENPKRTEQTCPLNQSIEDPMSDPNRTEGGTKNNASMDSNANPKLSSNSETRTGNESSSLEGADRVGHSNNPGNLSVGSVEHVDSMTERRVQKEVVEENRAPSNCVNPETIVDNQDASLALGSVEHGSVHMEQSNSSNAESRRAIEKPDQTCDSMEHGPTSVEHGPASVEHGPTSVEHGPASVEHGPTSVEHGPASVEHGPTSVEHGPTSVEQRMELSTSSSQDTKMTNAEPSIPLIERLPESEPLTEVQDVEQPSISFSASGSSNPTIDRGRLVKTPKRVPGPSKSEQVTFEPETADSISDSDTIRGRLDEVVKGLCIGSSSDHESSLSSYRSSNSSSPQSVLLNEDERSDPNAEPLAVPNTPPDAIDAEPDAVAEPVEENEEASQSILPKNVAQERSVIEGYQDSSDEEPVISRTRSDWQAADGKLNEVWDRFNERLDNETALNPPTDPKTPASNSEGVTDNPDDDINTFEHLAEKRRKHREKIAQGSSLKKYRFRADTILEDLLSISDSEEIPNHSVAKPTPRDIKETLPLDAVIKLPSFKSQSFPSVAKMVTFVFNENIRLPPLNQEEDPALVRRAFGSRLKKLESQYPSFKHGFFSDIEDEVILLRFGKLIRALRFTVKESQKLVLALTTYRKGGQTADRKKARSYLSAYVGLPLLHYRRLADIFQRVTFLLTRESEATLFSPETIKKIVQFFNKHGVDKVGECRKAAGINPIVGDHVIHDMYWQHRIIKNDMKKPLRRFTREESYYVLYKVLKQAKTYDVKSIESSEINWHKVAHKLARIPTTCQRHWETRIKPIILTHLAGEDCLDMSWKLRFYKQVCHDPKVFHRSNINYKGLVDKYFPNQTVMVLQRCMDNDFLRTEKALQIERTMAKLPPLSFKESLAIFIKRFGESKNTKWDDYHLKHMEGIISCYGELKDTIDFEDSDDEGPDFTKDKVNDVVNDSSCSN